MVKVKLLGIIVILALVVGGAAPFLASSGPAVAQDEKFQLAPLNPEFLDFLQQPPESSCGYVPPTMDLSHLKEIPVQRERALLTQQPSTWDWRDQDKVTPVKDQEPCGTCWAFGTTSVLESAVLLGESADYDFSEQSVALCVDRSWVYLYDDPTDPCQAGGNSFKASEVFIKKGAVLELCNPYDTDGLQCGGTCDCDSCPPVKKVTGYRHVTDDQSRTDLIKAAVYERPVTMAFYYDETAVYPDETYGPIYDCHPCDEYANHMVSIIGWDDSVPHPNPAHSGTGAWLVKNSWGTEWGNDGYFWLAYDSSSMCEIAYLEYGDYDASEKLYYWDEAGIMGAVGLDTTSYWMASVFTSEQDGDLTHVDFWTTSNNADYEIYVYDDGDPSDGLSTLFTSQVGSCAEFGYYSISLTTPVPVTNGQKFTVAVKMTTPGFHYPIPVEYEITDFCEPPIQSGVCYMKHQVGDSWEDADTFAGIGVNVCLRAKITEPPTVANVDVRIEGENDTIWSGSVTVGESTITDDDGIEHYFDQPTALGALEEASQAGGFSYTVHYWEGMGLAITAIDGVGDWNGPWWMFLVDSISAQVGADAFILNESSPPNPPHQEVLFAFTNTWSEIPLKLEVDDTTPDVGDSFTVTVTEYDADLDEWSPTEGATVYADTSYITYENGEVEITSYGDTIDVYAEKDGYIRSNRVTVTVSPSISLYEGWNLISLPLIPENSDITEVISDDTLASGDVSNVGIVRGYDPATGDFPRYIPATGGDLTEMRDGYGYWVFMNTADTLTVTGRVTPLPPEVSPTYDVVVGWNLIGFKSTADMDNTDYLTDIAYPVLWGYEPDEGYFKVHPKNEHPDGGDDPTIGDMEVGHGYWLWATSSGTIVP